MVIDIFYMQPNTSPYKITWALMFFPAFAAILVHVIKTWRTHTWQPVVVLVLLLAAHVAYSATAGHMIASRQSVERWYAPEPRGADAPRFIDDPTPTGKR